MKSEYESVLDLALHILADIVDTDPAIHEDIPLQLFVEECARDLHRIEDLFDSGGLSFFTITLPICAKWLEKSLDAGFLLNPRPHLMGAKSKVDSRPKFLWVLWRKIFEEDGTLRLIDVADYVGSLRQILMFAKKLRIQCHDRFTNEAIDTFREIERSLPAPWDHTWDDDHPRWTRRFGHPLWGRPRGERNQTDMFDSDPMHGLDLDLDWEGFGSFTARIVSQFGEVDHFGLNLSDLDATVGLEPNASIDPYVLSPKHGPGAVSDKHDGTKYDHKFWSNRLEQVFPYDFFGSPNSGFADDVHYREFPSRLHAVPKTATGPRLIASEPTAHQWVQGALARWLEDKLRSKDCILHECIDFRNQSASRELAREASASGSHATVDLSSASDRLTCRLVEYCFQANRSLLDAMHACRTRAVLLSPVGDDSDIILLRKFATQGSALTFPVQTVIFTMIAIWSVALARGVKEYSAIKELAKEVRVFGDDIIIPTDGYPVLVRMLSSLALRVNVHKSFSLGKFRESCGMDAYDGVDVTPAYCRQLYDPAPESLVSVLQQANNFYRKGYWQAANFLLETIPEAELRLLPFVRQDSGTLGIATGSGDSCDHLPRRWNKDLQRAEVKTITVEAKPSYKRGKGHGDLTQFFYAFRHNESLTDITPYKGGQIATLRHRKVVRWVPADEAGED